ncbi:MAG TPA: glycine cleavage system aminomethyltransferase GcvT [Bryobacteraceae bacterium]|nr:glycine cleavage system aminomethyltransferase GcvT [Bryobacteraceae bacterium]
MDTAPAVLRQTPLNAVHRAAGAKMVDFGGWDMPVQYSGILDEHAAVRTRAGLFDVSHMGEILVTGPQALALVNWVSCNDAAKLQIGQAHYSGLLLENGGFVDDILVHKFADDRYFLCVNASNQDKDFSHIQQQCTERGFDAVVENIGPTLSQIAIQGPRAVETLQKLTATPLAPIQYYWFTSGEVSGAPATLARTGYTGEDGFEIYVPNNEAPRLWKELLGAGEEFGIKPAGLGARNTLRLEAAMALYGHEITDELNPLEAGLRWIVKFGKGDFLGKEKLLEIQAAGLKNKLCGFQMNGRGIGRDGYEIQVDGAKAGWVTSGGPGPTVGKNIGLCYLPVEKSGNGQPIHVMIRNQAVDAEVIPTPFYKRAK